MSGRAEESLKWSMPSFLYAGGILCGMAAFKAHCTFGFWKGSLVLPPDKISDEEAMGQFGRITEALRSAVEEGVDRLHQAGDEAQ